MRQANIFDKKQLAGVLTENDTGYKFHYFPEYLSLETAKAVSLTLPLQNEAYISPTLFPFFDGLIPEEWLLDVALRNTDISILDRMSLLLTCRKDYIGAVNVTITNPKDDEEPALTLNGRKKKLQREDFIKSAATLGIESVTVERLINKYIKLLPKFEVAIQNSFLSAELKEKCLKLLRERVDRLASYGIVEN